KHAAAAILSRGDPPVVCFKPDERGHANFLPESWRRIRANSAWSKRLQKPHTSARHAFSSYDGAGLRELDSCNSSDALLMNVFCYPRLLRDERVPGLLGVHADAQPEFGFRARVPLLRGCDATEVDMRLGDLLVEAKLTESDFQTCSERHLARYRDVDEVFEREDLPRIGERHASYQLIRNVLAAHALASSFCVLLDARRPDLLEQWYAVMRCVRAHDLRVRCKVLTWQELARVLPVKLKTFLAEKYGISDL
ncbi:MAG TPA: hypothetical protein VFU76_17620, partial [Terriglobales bacterium]|nr:hypothetical protein [Terriglobales bacterium]